MSATVQVSTSVYSRRFTWMWLAYSGFLLVDPLMEPSLNRWVGTLFVFALLVVIFAYYIRASDTCNDRARLWLIGATFALALATFPWNAGGSCLFVYVASFIAFSVASTRIVLSLFAVEALGIIGERFIFHHRHSTFYVNWPNALIAIFLVVVIGGSNIFFAQQKRADSKLRLAQEEIEALAAMAERERIARDLHDVLGHTLSVIVLKAELAKRLIATNPERATAEIEDVESTARTALAEVREAIGGYRTRGLMAEIEAARHTLDTAGVALQSTAREADAVGLSAAEETVLSLALREAVTNIVRHARAKTCRLRLVSQDGRRRLLIEDDGEHPLAREGNGLRGMRERVEALGGSLSLEREGGTRLLIELPLRTTTA